MNTQIQHVIKTIASVVQTSCTHTGLFVTSLLLSTTLFGGDLSDSLSNSALDDTIGLNRSEVFSNMQSSLHYARRTGIDSLRENLIQNVNDLDTTLPGTSVQRRAFVDLIKPYLQDDGALRTLLSDKDIQSKIHNALTELITYEFKHEELTLAEKANQAELDAMMRSFVFCDGPANKPNLTVSSMEPQLFKAITALLDKTQLKKSAAAITSVIQTTPVPNTQEQVKKAWYSSLFAWWIKK